jgi:hypothetical protein
LTIEDSTESFVFEENHLFFLPITTKTQTTLVRDSIVYMINLVLIDHCGAKRISVGWTINHSKDLPFHKSVHFLVEGFFPQFSIRSRHSVVIADWINNMLGGSSEMH